MLIVGWLRHVMLIDGWLSLGYVDSQIGWVRLCWYPDRLSYTMTHSLLRVRCLCYFMHWGRIWHLKLPERRDMCVDITFTWTHVSWIHNITELDLHTFMSRMVDTYACLHMTHQWCYVFCAYSPSDYSFVCKGVHPLFWDVYTSLVLTPVLSCFFPECRCHVGLALDSSGTKPRM